MKAVLTLDNGRKIAVDILSPPPPDWKTPQTTFPRRIRTLVCGRV